MIRKIYYLCSCILLMTGCTKDDIAESSEEDVRSGRIMLIGGFAPDTRIAIGEKEGESYPVMWTADDALGIFTVTEGAEADNIAARLDASSEGNSSGKFIASDPISMAPEGDTELLLYYPYRDKVILKEETTTMDSELTSSQEQMTSGDSRHLGRYTLAYASAIMRNEEDLVQFHMKHAMAYVRILVSSNELSGCKLRGAMLCDKDNGTPLSGSYSVDLATGNVTPAESAVPWVSTTLAEAVSLSEQRELWLAAFPADFKDKSLYVAVTLERDAFGEQPSATITIPVGRSGELKANAVNTIEISDLKLSDNAVKWYEPVETRLLVGGWAYGDANCVVSKTGINNTFSVKARGDFSKVQEPKYVQIIVDNLNNPGAAPMTSCNGVTDMSVTPVSEDYTIALKGVKTTNTGYDFGCGKVAVLADDRQTILWEVTLWISETLREHTYKCGTVVLDRNIGAKNPTWGDWKNGGVYYQWGRPVPFGWSNKGLEGMKMSQLTIQNNLDYVLAHPLALFGPDSKLVLAHYDWHLGAMTGEFSDRKNDFWGNSNPNSVDGGHKTVYDPCPKGYRVVTPAVLEEVKAAAVLDKSIGKLYRLKYVIDESNTAYYPLAGAWMGYNYNGNNNKVRTFTNNQSYALYWSNAPAGMESHDAWSLYVLGLGKTTPSHDAPADVDVEKYAGARANAYPVRCMVDSEKR